jgi:hypothetical protein
MEEDYEKFHFLECDMPSEFHSTFVETMLFEGLRAICQMLHHFDWDVDRMRKFMEKGRYIKTVFDLGTVKDSNYYKKLFLIFMNYKDNDAGQHEHLMMIRDDFLEFSLKYNHKLASAFSPKHNKKFLKSLLKKFVVAPFDSVCYNNINMTTKDPKTQEFELRADVKKYEKKIDSAGNPVFSSFDPFCDLLCFTCAPSVILLHLDGKTAWIVVRPIKTGGFIEVSSDVPYAISASKSDRQLKIKKLTRCECSCEACYNDWPELREMPIIGDDQIDAKMKILIKRWKKLDACDSLNRYNGALPLLEYFGKSLPNQNYFEIYKYFMQDLYLLSQPKLFNDPKP